MSQRVRLTRAKIVILGAAGVGKTAFAVRYITRRFIGEYDQNKEMTYTHRVPWEKGEEVFIEILDTANDSSRAVLENHIRWADGFVLIYSITDRESFQRLTHYHALARSMRKPESTLPLVVVGNKKDIEHARCVSEKGSKDMGSKFGCPNFEISIAEAPEDVMTVMDEVLRQVKREMVRSMGFEKKSTLNNMKRVLKKKMARSRSDTLS